MAVTIIRQAGRAAGYTLYESPADAQAACWREANRLGIDDESYFEVRLGKGAAVGAAETASGDEWVVTAVHEARQTMGVIKCDSRSEAEQVAIKLARLIVRDLIRTEFQAITGRPLGPLGKHWLFEGETVVKESLKRDAPACA